MALVAPPFVIEAPTRAPLPHGLFSVSAPIDNPGFNWQNGVTWMDQACEVLPDVIVADCDSPSGLPKDFSNGLSQGESAAFTVYGEFTCSPLSHNVDQAQAEADRRLLTREEQAVTAQVAALLTGGGALAGTDVSGSLQGYPEMVAALEQHLASEYGSQGVLLLTLPVLYSLTSDALVRVGNGLQTLAGTPIVIERTGAVSGFELGIIPAPVIYRSEVFTSSNRPGDLLDRYTNDLYAVAERSYVLGWVPCGGAYASLSA